MLIDHTTEPPSVRYLPLLLVAPALWGGNFVVGRFLSPDIPPLWLNLMRWTVALAIMLPVALPSALSETARIKKDACRLVLLSLTGVVGFNTTLYAALQTVTASQAAIGFALTPFAIILLNALCVGYMPSRQVIVAALVSFSGIVLAYRSESGGGLLLTAPGTLMLIAPPVLVWSAYCILLNRMRLDVSPMTSFLCQIMIGVVVLTGLVIATDQPLDFLPLEAHVFWAVAYLGIFASALAFFCWQLALQRVSANLAGASMNVLPMTSLILACLFLGETMSLQRVAGIGLIAIGIYVNHCHSDAGMHRD